MKLKEAFEQAMERHHATDKDTELLLGYNPGEEKEPYFVVDESAPLEVLASGKTGAGALFNYWRKGGKPRHRRISKRRWKAKSESQVPEDVRRLFSDSLHDLLIGEYILINGDEDSMVGPDEVHSLLEDLQEMMEDAFTSGLKQGQEKRGA